MIHRAGLSAEGAAERAVDFECSEGIEFLTPPSTPPVASSPMLKVFEEKQSPAATARRDVSTGINKSQGIEIGSGGGKSGERDKRKGRNAQTGVSSRSPPKALTTATSVMRQAQRRRMRSASPFQCTGEGLEGGGAPPSDSNTPATRRRVASMSPPKSAAKPKGRTNAMRAEEQADRLPRWWSKSVPLTASLLGSRHNIGGSQDMPKKTRSTTSTAAQGGKADDKMEGGKVGEEDEGKQASTSADVKNIKDQDCAKSRFESMSEHEIIAIALQDLRLIRKVGLQAAAEVRMPGGEYRASAFACAPTCADKLHYTAVL